ncbi:hypothetical protein [Pelagibacterium luteolum]|uniref:Uncharacterized protein n=1 Tax=Pelagibacterium luteolum TaxID=440168 RepID=A0A1G7YDR2_9HYPH|nr:hypothetical protein [Pelagibacterium luteolum]SDG94692.1 hypothetical protein SAMN04487974_11378 [Pelagibacterium luteolum]
MTKISIDGEKFLVDGRPIYEGRTYKGNPVEGLLFNTRMVQAIFDDENPETAENWAYPDTGKWDADRNVDEFIAALPTYLAHGVKAFTLNLQGGMPITGTERVQPWLNTAIDPKGNLKPKHMARLHKVLAAADALGMVAIVGYYYFGQDQYLDDDDAIRAGVVNATRWLLETGFENILVEINNECDIPHYDHDLLMPGRVHELVELARSIEIDGRKLPIATSFSGGFFHSDIAKGVPTEAVIEASDFIIVHSNKWNEEQTREVVRAVRAKPAFQRRPMPIVINEDSVSAENMFAAVEVYAPWGYYDQGKNNYRDGYQSPPVNWGISTPEKERFFKGVAEITGTKVAS